MWLDGVFECAAVDLDRVRDAPTGQRTGENHRAHHQVVRDGDLGLGPCHDLLDRVDIRPQVPVELGSLSSSKDRASIPS